MDQSNQSRNLSELDEVSESVEFFEKFSGLLDRTEKSFDYFTVKASSLIFISGKKRVGKQLMRMIPLGIDPLPM